MTDRELERRVRGLFLGGFDGLELTGEMAEALGAGLRGVVLFARNVSSPAQVARLSAAVHAARGDGACLVGMDQEGGRVARMREGLWVAPAMRELGRLAEPGALALARQAGGVMGGRLRWCGVNLNFAPVLDVDTNPANPVIGDRSLSADPARVAALGRALAEGLQAGLAGSEGVDGAAGEGRAGGGVAACGKHFPGHGDTHQDSHLTLPRLPHDRARLDRVELVPFRAAIASQGHAEGATEVAEGSASAGAGGGIASLMTAHVVFEALGETRPATMSPAVIGGLLRGELGFDGVVVSDDLEMKAIADHYDIGEVAVSAIGAGVDLLLCCHRLDLIERAVSAVLGAVASGRLSREQIDAAAARVQRMAEAYAVSPDAVGGDDAAICRAEAAVAARWAELAGRENGGDGGRMTSGAGAVVGPDPTDFLGAAADRPYDGGAQSPGEVPRGRDGSASDDA